MYHPLTVAEN